MKNPGRTGVESRRALLKAATDTLHRQLDVAFLEVSPLAAGSQALIAGACWAFSVYRQAFATASEAAYSAAFSGSFCGTRRSSEMS